MTAGMRDPRPEASGTDAACQFCEIATGRRAARIRYEDADLVAFHNHLRWAPVMLLVAPKHHMRQQEFWASPLLTRAAGLAVKLGRQDCPHGFRVLSNFGRDALQSQEHGHLHVIGGRRLGLYLHVEGVDPLFPIPDEVGQA